MSIPARIVLASSDLNARSRVLSAAAGGEVVTTGALGFAAALEGAGILILDLDEGGEAALDELVAARAAAPRPIQVIGFLSHVDRALGRAARAAGCHPIARGRFWTELPEILSALSDPSS